MKNNKQLKNNFTIIQLFFYNFVKIKNVISFWVLFILSLVLFIVTPFYILYFSHGSANNLLENYDYIFLIFENIILILFILLLLNKLFSNELEDGSYLLILSRPFSRTTIFLVKLFSVWFFTIIFMLLIFLVSIISGLIANASYHTNLFFNYYQIIKQTFFYSLAIMFFSSSAILFASSFLSSNSVLLIVVIFCSMFLAGGMPYALITSLENSNYIAINDKGSPSVKNIKTSLLFNKELTSNLKKSCLENAELLTPIYKFITGLSSDELNFVTNLSKNVRFLDVKSFYEKFYKFLSTYGLLSNEASYPTADFGNQLTIYKWNNYNNTGKWNGTDLTDATDRNPIVINFNGNLKLTFDKSLLPLKNIDEIQKDIARHQYSIIEKQLFDAFKTNMFDFFGDNMNNLYRLNKYLILFFSPADASVQTINDSNNYYKIENWPIKDQKSFPPNFFKLYLDYNKGTNNTYSIKAGEGKDFNSLLQNFFEDNMMNFFLGSLISLVGHQYYMFNLATANHVVIDKNWQRYSSLSTLYNILIKFNLLEQWNQLWTSFFAPQDKIFFDFYNENINFSQHNNQLMSYADFPLLINDQGLINTNISNYMPTDITLISYMSISLLLIIGSNLIFKFRNIQ